jgi:hypothetical protein
MSTLHKILKEVLHIEEKGRHAQTGSQQKLRKNKSHWENI